MKRALVITLVLMVLITFSVIATVTMRSTLAVNTDARGRAEALLEDARCAIIVQHLDDPHGIHDYKEPESGRLDDYGVNEWPRVLGRVHGDAERFQILSGDTTAPDSTQDRYVESRFAFHGPLKTNIVFSGWTTALCLDGIAPEGRIRLNEYATVCSRGEMAGTIDVNTYATVYIDGDLTGTLVYSGKLSLLVTGDLNGKVTSTAGRSCLAIVLGRVTGRFNGGKIAIAGRMMREDVERHIQGPAVVYLQDTDLESGTHKIGDLTVHAGARVSPP